MSESRGILPPKIEKDIGAIHPINHMKDSIMSLLASFGFDMIEGPEIETEEFNFDMLNIKKSHPARQMHDTFYVENKSSLLRTHTSPVQIRGMLQKNHLWHLSLEVKFIEKMMTLLIYQCFIKLRVYMLIKMLLLPN